MYICEYQIATLAIYTLQLLNTVNCIYSVHSLLFRASYQLAVQVCLMIMTCQKCGIAQMREMTLVVQIQMNIVLQAMIIRILLGEFLPLTR